MRIVEIPDDGIVRSPIMNGEDTVGEMRVDLSYLPTLEGVAPVVHARWEYNSSTDRYVCSHCRENALMFKKDILYGGDLFEVYLTDYCPHCGAKMDLED
jgi:hypothetical protein